MPIRVDEDGPIAVVTMDREQALNTFDAEQLSRLIQTFGDLGHRNEIRAVVLTGAGTRAFAAGADVKAMAALSQVDGMAFSRLGQRTALAIEELRQPVIAAVNGYALGGGCEIALACDMRLASENAVFAQPEVTLGIPPGWGGSQRLPRLVGPGRAAEMILTGRRVSAEEALRWGLVNTIYPRDELLDQAKKLAHVIAANSPMAVTVAKELMRSTLTSGLAAGLEREAMAFGNSFESADQREGMAAFVEKRKPVFRGAATE